MNAVSLVLATHAFLAAQGHYPVDLAMVGGSQQERLTVMSAFLNQSPDKAVASLKHLKHWAFEVAGNQVIAIDERSGAIGTAAVRRDLLAAFTRSGTSVMDNKALSENERAAVQAILARFNEATPDSEFKGALGVALYPTVTLEVDGRQLRVAMPSPPAVTKVLSEVRTAPLRRKRPTLDSIRAKPTPILAENELSIVALSLKGQRNTLLDASNKAVQRALDRLGEEARAHYESLADRLLGASKPNLGPVPFGQLPEAQRAHIRQSLEARPGDYGFTSAAEALQKLSQVKVASHVVEVMLAYHDADAEQPIDMLILITRFTR